jgi:hypothetical protein
MKYNTIKLAAVKLIHDQLVAAARGEAIAGELEIELSPPQARPYQLGQRSTKLTYSNGRLDGFFSVTLTPADWRKMERAMGKLANQSKVPGKFDLRCAMQ